MSRDMIAAQQQIFSNLDKFCERAGEPMPEAGRERYFAATSDLARQRLKKLVCRSAQRFTSHSALLHLDSEDCGTFLVSLGLLEQSMDDLEGYPRIELDSGIFQVSILESKVAPVAEPSLIREAIAWGSREEPDYAGHPYVQVLRLFPSISAVELPGTLSADEVATLFWKVVVAHCKRGPSWISDDLADDLLSLSQVTVPGLPYAELCWAALSHDPRSLFLTLYRCLEAAYAFEVSSRINVELGLTCSWEETARALGAHAGWRPQEETSLVKLLRNAKATDVETISSLLSSEKVDVYAGAGASIYQLRNGIVHYRPEMELVAIDQYDWSAVCSAMSRIVVSVLSVVHKL